ncbi:MAG: Cupredoxin-like domain [Thermomicrobiales bacterium]|jgi:uncharacterized cupredoxin-like copper-binding protein|nr:Cupredoxin-like domain [Thermomicrobiales bacterium]
MGKRNLSRRDASPVLLLAAVVMLFVALVWTGRVTPVRGAPDASPVAGSPAASPTAATPVATTPPARGARQSVSTAGKVTIYLTDQGFMPSYVESTNGHPLIITLVNSGTRPHAFRIDALGIAETLAPGETKTITIENPDLGDFTYVSDAPGDEGMQGRLAFYI